MELGGLRKSVPINDLDCLRGLGGPVEPKALFAELSNRSRDPENETAAPTGIGSGGWSGTSKADNLQGKKYLTAESLARKFPILAVHFGLPLEGGAA